MPRILSLSPENGFLNFFKLKLGFLDFWLDEGKDETAPEEFVKEWVMKSPKILFTFADISPIDLYVFSPKIRVLNCGKNGYLGEKKSDTNSQFLAHRFLSGSFNNLENDWTKNSFIGFQL